MKDVYSDIKKSWQKRSGIYEDRLEGILPKSFPVMVNKYLDSWMFNQISQLIKTKNTEISILDLGCGYGRLSKSLLDKYSKIKTYGIDVSNKYVDLYNRLLKIRGKAVVGDIRHLPYKDSSMDLVFAVTSLMYIVDRKNQELVFKEIFRVLKKNGKFVFIERHPFGYKLVTLGGLVDKLRGKKNKEIKAVSYTRKIILERIRGKGELESCSGIPFFTILLPVFFFMNVFSKSLLNFLLKVTHTTDNIFRKILTPSLYISYTGRKV